MKEMKVLSNVNDLKQLNLTAVRVSETQIEFYLDGKVIHTWDEPLLKDDEDIWYAFEVNDKSYDVNFFKGEFADDDIERISLYGLYVDDGNDENSSIHTEHSDWHTIEVISLIEQVMTEIQNDIARGDLDCIEELLKFVPIENLKGYLPSIY